MITTAATPAHSRTCSVSNDCGALQAGVPECEQWPDPGSRSRGIRPGAGAGGERAAAIYSLTETAKPHALDPEDDLRQVLERIAEHPVERVHDLRQTRHRGRGLSGQQVQSRGAQGRAAARSLRQRTNSARHQRRRQHFCP